MRQGFIVNDLSISEVLAEMRHINKRQIINQKSTSEDRITE